MKDIFLKNRNSQYIKIIKKKNRNNVIFKVHSICMVDLIFGDETAKKFFKQFCKQKVQNYEIYAKRDLDNALKPLFFGLNEILSDNFLSEKKIASLLEKTKKLKEII